MIQQVIHTIEEHDLIRSDDRILIGFSGGPDSVALLHVLAKLRRRFRLTLQAVYVNHQIRRRAAGDEELFCAEMCDRLKVPFEVVTVDIPALTRKRKKGVEETARDFRYQTFDEIANRDRCHRIAVGHHLDDRAETVLFRVLRGTGVAGLAGIPIQRGRIIRPLYDVTKDQILTYLKKQSLAFCTDRTNRDTRYDRNYVRYRLLSQIRERLNPAVTSALINLSETAREEDALLNEIVRQRACTSVSMTAGGKIELDLKKVGAYHKALRRRLLRRCLIALSSDGRAPDKAVVERLDGFCASAGKAMSLPGKLEAVRVDETLVLRPDKAIKFVNRIEVGRKCPIESLKASLTARKKSWDGKLDRRKQSSAIVVDWDKIVSPLTVRNIRVGDRFVPLGMRGSKTVSNYLTDRKVSRVYRDEIPVVCDKEGIIWLVGYEIADRVKIDKSTEKVLAIGFRQNRTDRAEAFRVAFGP